MQVPFYNFTDLHHDEFKTQVLSRFQEIVNENSFVEGKFNALFEQEFAQKKGAKHCLLVANGTDAIEMALVAVGVRPGDKVGVPGITFYATAEAVLNIGASPVFIDVNPQTGLICPKSLSRMVESYKLKAIIPVHIYGQPAPIEELEKICRPLQIPIIEDAAQAEGAYLKAGPVGCSSNITTFSFYPTKNLSAFGDAGAILTQDDEVAKILKQLRNHGRGPQGFERVGRNSRCDHLQAAVLHLKLQHIDEQNKKRKQVAQLYYRHLKNLELRLPPEEFIQSSSWHLFPIGLKDRSEKYALANFLKSREIGHSLFYERSMKQEPLLSEFPGETLVADSFAATTLCIPIHPFMDEKQVQAVALALGDFKKGNHS